MPYVHVLYIRIVPYVEVHETYTPTHSHIILNAYIHKMCFTRSMSVYVLY